MTFNPEWYRTGRVSILNGATEVTGVSTEWLKEGIKKGDVFILMGNICEISDVTGNTKLELKEAYSGESVENSTYKIIPRRKSTLTTELAEKIQALIDEWPLYAEIADSALIAKKLGIYIDEDGDAAQDYAHGGEDLRPSADDDDTATDEEVNEAISNILNP